MSIYEFLIFALYLGVILSSIITIQIYNPGKAMREYMVVEETNEKFIQSEFEEPDSDCSNEKAPFNPDTEEYTMSENPMLRQRHKEEQSSPSIDMVD